MRWSFLIYIAIIVASGCKPAEKSQATTSAISTKARSGNPIFEGWYADPEVAMLDGKAWIFPTTSTKYKQQVYFDAFSSSDLVNWTKHERVLDTTKITWAKQAMWAPSIIENQGKYFLFFSANDIQKPGNFLYKEDDPINHFGGIGIAVADQPEGPYKDYLGKPLISDFHHGAQPIDQFVFRDDDGQHYLFYGGWKHCNLGKLSADFKTVTPWEDGQLFHEITPENYVEGPFMFKRKGKYYLMWSEGGWGNGTYQVAYAIADHPTGPFKREATILSSDENMATGAGHNSAFCAPNTDDWYMVYHRRPIPNEDRDHRVTCIDRMYFNEDGTIKPMVMTREGVKAIKLITAAVSQ